MYPVLSQLGQQMNDLKRAQGRWVDQLAARCLACERKMADVHQKWEAEQLPVLQEVLGYDIIVPVWWMGSTDSQVPDAHAKAVMRA